MFSDLEDSPPEDILRWALTTWPEQAAILTSFQAESMVLVDMACRIYPAVRVITLDTGRLPQETYDMIERVRQRYQVNVEVHFPNAHDLQALVRRHGPNLFYDSVEGRLACCRVRKVEPMRRALRGLAAWITGLRRGQSIDRADVRKVAEDQENPGLLKLSPLADWTWDDVDAYSQKHDVPRHPLYKRGYTSIGCAPCTRPTTAGEDPRAGRWWWEKSDNKECGMHPRISTGELESQLVTIGGA